MDLRCRIELLGELRVVQGEQVHTRFRTHKAAYLLAYLALNMQQAHPRERLVEALWPDKEIEIGRASLSTALAQLRRQLEPPGVSTGSILVADRQQMRINTEVVATDIAEFERLLRLAKRTEERAPQAALLQQAVHLYRGEMLPGCYEEWATSAQAHYQTLYLDTLRQLIRLLEETEQYAEALSCAQKAATADPYAEEIVRAQMRLLVRLRQPSVALQTYQRLEQIYQRDLGALPSAATRQIAETIRQDPRARALLRAEMVAREKPAGATPTPVLSVPSTPTPPGQPALPLQLTRFFGREVEREQIVQLLQTPGVRLVSLLGPGGAGKTRLAVEVARHITAAFANRVWFAALADIPDASLIPSVLINCLRIPPDGSGDPLERVITSLGEDPCLLVLDNLEHLQAKERRGKGDQQMLSTSAALIRLLLERVPGLVCLVTSRQVLRLGGEQEFMLPPLALPGEGVAASLEALLANESVALYVDRARNARLDFALTSQNGASVAALCRKLEGMPLAIEMAAAWAKTITPQKMLERLEHQLEVLVSRRQDLPLRHQSLRATIEWSYDLLDLDLRAVFARLSVFRGEWTLEAAEAVCGAGTMQALLQLQEQSLIVAREEEESTRYRMLEPLREFGMEKLRELDALDFVRNQHAVFYAQLVNQLKGQMHSPEEKNAFDTIAAEHDNLREAIHNCLCNQETADLGGEIALGIMWFWKRRGHIVEGSKWLEQSLQRCPDFPTVLRANLLDASAILMNVQGHSARAKLLQQEAVAIVRQLDNVPHLAVKLNNLAIIAYDMGDIELARTCWEENLQISREGGWDFLLGGSLANLGELAYDEGELERASALLGEATVVRRRMGDYSNLGRDLGLLGKVACRQAHWERAADLFAECLTLLKSVEDRPSLLEALEGVVGLAAKRGPVEHAASLLAYTTKARAQMQLPLPPDELRDIEVHHDRIREHLPIEAKEQAWKAGESWTQEQACSHTFELLAAHLRPPHPKDRHLDT